MEIRRVCVYCASSERSDPAYRHAAFQVGELLASSGIEIVYGGVSFVFTGDVTRDVERTLAPSFNRAPIRILKVPHHGSGTSSSQEFLGTLRPDVAVISAGRGNPFGHPVASVLERYRNIGAAIYRTDEDGAVSVETDGTKVTITAFTGRRLTLTTYGR